MDVAPIAGYIVQWDYAAYIAKLACDAAYGAAGVGGGRSIGMSIYQGSSSMSQCPYSLACWSAMVGVVDDRKRERERESLKTMTIVVCFTDHIWLHRV